jgi:lipoprotein LprG
MAHRRPFAVGFLAVLAVLAMAVLPLAAACTGGASTASASMPAAGTLLKTASSTMAGVHSVHFVLNVNGTLSGVPVQSATGDLNSQGQAKGNAKLTTFGQLTQVDFVLLGKDFYLKGPTGGYSKVSAAMVTSLFDPSAILDPNRGIAKVLSSVRSAQTVGREQVDGADTYKITGSVAKDAVSSLVPGLDADVQATLWVTADSKDQPVKAEFAVPGQGGSQGATVDVDISNVNVPVTVTAPA